MPTTARRDDGSHDDSDEQGDAPVRPGVPRLLARLRRGGAALPHARLQARRLSAASTITVAAQCRESRHDRGIAPTIPVRFTCSSTRTGGDCSGGRMIVQCSGWRAAHPRRVRDGSAAWRAAGDPRIQRRSDLRGVLPHSPRGVEGAATGLSARPDRKHHRAPRHRDQYRDPRQPPRSTWSRTEGL